MVQRVTYMYIVGSNPVFYGAQYLRIIILLTDRLLILVPFQHGFFQLRVSLKFCSNRKFLKCSERIFKHSVSVS